MTPPRSVTPRNDGRAITEDVRHTWRGGRGGGVVISTVAASAKLLGAPERDFSRKGCRPS